MAGVFVKALGFYASISSLTRPFEQVKEEIEVGVVSLDNFVYRMGYPQPDFVKIEGFEGEVLNGASRVLAQVRPIILCEIHNRQVAEKVLKKLREAGYLIFGIERDFELVDNPKSGGHWLARSRVRE